MLVRSRRELLVAAWGALTFAAVLASYFVFRPVRDALVLDGKPEDIPLLFTATFVAVSVVSPAWSALLARGGGRRRFVPIAFHVFAACAAVFSALVYTEAAPVWVGRVFYVWSAVFNLFVVSVFWSLLADLLGPDVAKRLYGPIAAGGTAGALIGPILTRELVGTIGVHGVLLMSAALLQLGAASLYALRRAGEDLQRETPGATVRDDAPPEPALPAALRGLARLRSPYLLAIVGYVLCTATAATFVYLEQASITKALLTTREARTELFATIDAWTNGGTLAVQTIVAPVLLTVLGPGLVLMALPLAQGIGITVLASAPALSTLMYVQIATRTVTHGLTRPARELLFTVVDRDDKYRAKNAIDTVVYRFGDFGSSWLHRGLLSLGAGSVALVAVTLPLVAFWIALAAALGIGFRRRLPPAARATHRPGATRHQGAHMTLDRRRFVLGSLAAGAAAACGSRKDSPPVVGSAPAPAPAPAPTGPAKKTILVLGGTGFLGPHVVEAALARGHAVTLFNRGKTRPHLFPNVEKLQGDRDGKLEALRGRTWDSVVDTSAYVPRITKLSAELLAPSVKQYINISTISVYADHDRPGADETAKLATMPDPASEEVKTHYGALKALCEQAAEAAMPGRVANVRPGLIIGPGNQTGRFTHWPWRMAQGGEVLCPGDGSTPTQYIDGRDLGASIVKLAEDGTVGVFNALGPERRITMKEVLEACNAAGGNKATLTWVDAAFLDKQEVAPWSELPMWFDATGEMAGFGTMSNARAVAAGLELRPILDTAKDTLAWLPTVPEDQRRRFSSTGISREKEEKVLAAWKARK